MRLFTEREIRLILFGVGAATTVALSIAIIISVVQNRGQRVTTGRVEPRESHVLEAKDVVIPEEYRTVSPSYWYVFRPRVERWNPEQIKRFWIDPRVIQLEELAASNDRAMIEFFERVP